MNEALRLFIFILLGFTILILVFGRQRITRFVTVTIKALIALPLVLLGMVGMFILSGLQGVGGMLKEAYKKEDHKEGDT